MSSEQWRAAVDQRKSQLDKLKLPLTLNAIQDAGKFHDYVETLSTRYAARGIASLFTQKLKPYLSHIGSFTAAISITNQGLSYENLIWGGIGTILECACQFAESLDNTFNMLNHVHQALPHFQEYMDLFPADVVLSDALCMLFGDVLDSYIHILRYLKRSGFRNIFRNLYSSDNRYGMRAIMARFEQHTTVFQSRAHLASARKNYSDHAQILSRLPPAQVQVEEVSYPLNTVPYLRNPAFYGRDDIILDLHSQIYETKFDEELLSSVLHGIGGVGKTQTALEYTYRYRSCFDAVFWLAAEDSVALSRAYCAIGMEVGIFARTGQLKTGQSEVSAVRDWLRKTNRTWLLVFDNVEDWTSIAAYWPSLCQTRGAAIVTTQRPSDLIPWTKFKISVTHFDVKTGSAYLLDSLTLLDASEEEKTEAREISTLVGGLPLYLTHISGHISQSQSSLKEYCSLIHDSTNVWQERREPSNWMYERTIDTVFDVALSDLGPRARRLINVLAFLNSDGVLEEILFPDAVQHRLEYLDCPDKASFFDIMADLHQRQLVKREKIGEGAILTMHRSLQEGVLKKLNREAESRSLAFLCALKALRRLIPKPSLLIQAETKKWYQMEAFLPQLLSLRRAYARSQPKIQGTLAFAEILFDVGMNMWDRGLTRDGQDVLRTSEKVLDQINHPAMSSVRANIHLVLAVILDDFGISGRSEALARRESALQIRQYLIDNKTPAERIPEDEILLFAAIMDLSGSYRQINQFGPLVKLCKRCYVKYQSWGDVQEIPYEYAKYYNDMSFQRAYYHDNLEAVECSRRAWVMMEMSDPTALLSNNYKLTWTIRLYHNGEHQKAIQELDAIFNHRLKTVGWQNYLTLQSQLCLGILYSHEGNWRMAEKYVSGVLQPETRSILPQETIIRARHYYAIILFNTPGRHDEAEQLHVQTKADMEKLIATSPPCLEESVADDESAMYDYLVHSGLRVSIFRAKDGKMPEETVVMEKEHYV